MRKPAFFICENKDPDQLRGNRYTDSTIPLLPKSEISSLFSSSVVVQPSLCRIWSQTPKTSFLTTRLILSYDFTVRALKLLLKFFRSLIKVHAGTCILQLQIILLIYKNI